ncbi:MAG TPA: GGDEF domain-containing protein [Thermoleophilaceae bacterium]|nr:GGDEF domain-containing protein [Thermoleophilaceae bacterium]
MLDEARRARAERLAQMDPQRELMARVLLWVILAGATFGLVGSLALPSSPAEVQGTLAICGISYLVAGLLWFVPQRLPALAVHAVLVFGIVAISLALYVNGASASDDEMFYLWVSLFAFYFFSRKQALMHMAFVAVAYGTVMRTQGTDLGEETVRWLVTVGSLTVAGLIVGALTQRTHESMDSLREAARTDSLTGLLNRKGFNETFEAEIARAARSGSTLALLVGDLDHFKQMNDRCGHQAGDQALVRVSEVLQEWTRGADRAARIGGEEFALLAPDSDDEAALRAAERVRTRVEEAFAGSAVELTMSFGVALFPGDGRSADQLLRSADDALYAAKAAGRNRTLLASPPLARAS